MKTIKYTLLRYILCVIVILAEVGGIIAFFTALAHYAPFLWTAAFITSFAAYLSIVNLDANPEFKIPWISVVLFLPPFGALLFAMFYKRKMRKKEIRHWENIKSATEGLARNTEDLNLLKSEDRLAYGKALAIIGDDPNAEVFQHTNTAYFPLGEDMWQQILPDLERAKHFIFLEYFIVQEGTMWDSMLRILERKAASGVEVRMLFDDVGCMATLPENYDAKLREKGIQCYRFSKLYPEATTAHNNRDHRKILVIDGKVGYTGGINLADEYINHIEKHGHWKDGGIRLEGAAVIGLTRLFLLNWDVNRKTVSDYARYLEGSVLEENTRNDGFFIPFGSGPQPAYERPVGKNVFLNLINQAQFYLYITTPYLIIDYDLTTALQNAATRGVDVRIVTPRIPDKELVQLLTRTSYSALMKHGVRIFEYTPGFIHAKTALSDDQYAIVGTINLDYRSLVHHYENAVWIYGSSVLRDIWQDIDQTLEVSEEIDKNSIHMTLFQKAIRDCIRLFSPLF